MKISIKYLAAIALFLPLFFTSCDSEKETLKYPYQEVENDPLQTRIYKLNNGLTVYLSLNQDEPRVQTNIAVRAGSKYDPAETTGLAHYLEHMLFKGNSKIASLDWENEKVLLQQISDLYEEHKNTEDADAKTMIYKKIDSISQLAAQYVVPNEYDKMISSLGAKGTNAYTSFERTVYINDIPANELDKWMTLESERFKELTLRLFHTELEAVYEEFNRSQDNDYRKQYFGLLELLFPNHQYGTQTTIGEGEHLKNPSMVNIHNYFETYYVPNNMAIILAGDIDYDETIEMIDKHFGSWQSKDIPAYTPPVEEPITEIKTKEVFGPNTERLSMAYRFNGSDSEDAMYLKLIDGMLSNGKAGLIDINLMQKQAVLEAYSNPMILKDYSMLYLMATPKQGQSLDEAKQLFLDQLNLIKQGEFDSWLPDAVVKNFKLNEIRYAESNAYRGYMLTDAFILEQDWNEVVNQYEAMSKITKEQIVDFAKKNFNNNYVVVYKKTGVDTSIYKVDKPQITPVDINRDNQSAFAMTFDSMPETRLKPLFLDFEKDIKKDQIRDDIKFYGIKNEVNGLFELNYVLEMGSNHDLEMAMAIDYLPFLGMTDYSAEELTQEFFKLGVDFDVYTSSDRIYVTLSGLQESFEKGLSLFEGLLADPVADDVALTNMVSNKLKGRDDNKKEKYYIHRAGLGNYAKYGADNPFKNILSADEMASITATQLTDKIKQLNSYEHFVFYYGPEEDDVIKSALQKYHRVPEELMPYPAEKEFPELENVDNLVYFVDFDMVQTELLMINKSQLFDKDLLPYANIFNEYFGAGLSSIVFQEIRESKALAYSAYCYYSSPSKKDKSHYLQAYIGTQTNKLEQATEAIRELMNNMPEAEGQFQDSKTAALKKIETERITKSSIFWTYYSAQQRGLNEDIRKDMYREIGNMEMENLKSFFNENIKDKKFSYCVIGRRDEVDFEALKKLGQVKELTLEEVFGY